MIDPILASLPFTHRAQLDFTDGMRFGLKITTMSADIVHYDITGATKAGTFKYTHTTDGLGGIVTETFNLGDIPIWVSASIQETYDLPGTNYIRVDLTANGDVMQGLCAGYVDGIDAISWPNTNLTPTVPGWGEIFRQQPTNPAAGAEMDFTTPVNTLGYIRAIAIPLVTDATVANRRVHIQLTIGGVAIFETFSDIDQPASTTYTYYFAPRGSIDDRLDNNVVLATIPDNLKYLDSWHIKTATLNLQAGDNFGQPYVLLEQFHTGY